VNQQVWTAVDDYVARSLIPSDPALDAALAASAEAGLPAINVTASQGKLLQLLAGIRGARRILEIGTLGGYSTIWLARALPADGRLVTLEIDERHAAVARSNVERAGVGAIVDIRIGRALDTLPLLKDEGAGPFDLTFIDADKPGNADYFQWALALSRPGSVIVVDNVVRGGAVADPDSRDPNVLGVHRLNELLRTETRVSATTIQTVGAKGYDGFTLAVVLGR
jgi:predicted O-methyltransferase YrrM